MAYTKGPWYLLETKGADFTSISTKDKLPLSDWNTDKQGNPVEDTIDDENEVLGTSEWLRAKPEDLKLMAASPELYEALKKAQAIIAMFMPNLPKCFNVDFMLLNQGNIEIGQLIERLRSIEE